MDFCSRWCFRRWEPAVNEVFVCLYHLALYGASITGSDGAPRGIMAACGKPLRDRLYNLHQFYWHQNMDISEVKKISDGSKARAVSQIWVPIDGLRAAWEQFWCDSRGRAKLAPLATSRLFWGVLALK